MTKDPNNFLDFDNIELKLPEDEGVVATEATTKSVSGMTVALTLIVLLLLGVLGGLVWWGSKIWNSRPPVEVSPIVVRPTPEENNEPESTTAEAEVETLEAMSSSNEIADIKADLDAIDIEALDKELVTIDAIFNEVVTITP